MMSINKQMSSIACPNRGISSSSFSSSSETRLVLLGKTGSGKSSTANSILGRKVFDTRDSSSSVTQRCRRACGEFCGQHLTVLDTPGLLDTHQTPQEVQRELRRSVSLLYPGPHAFLLVIQIGRFTQEEKEVIQQIKKAMGSHALSFSVMVFTHGDVLEEGASVKQYLIDECSDLAELVAACGGRYCVFNNHNSKNKEQVCELLAKVDNMIQGNGGRFYTIQMLQRAEEDIALELHKERGLVNEREEMLIKIQGAKIKVWYERELEMVQQKNKKEMEDLKKKQEMERQTEEKVARKKEEAFLQEIGKKDKERKIQEMLRLIEVQREEEEKREELLEEFNHVTKMLEDQLGREEKMRRAVEEKIQTDQMENERKDRGMEIQQKQRKQVIRQKEEINRYAFQKELDKLSQSLQEQSRREEEWKKQMEDLLRWQREKNERDGDIQMENQKTDRRRTDVQQQELKVIKMKTEQQVSEENHRRQLEESLQKGREKSNMEIQTAKKECDVTNQKTSVRKHSTISTVTGYVQEMGLVGLNTALERVRTPCCIQ